MRIVDCGDADKKEEPEEEVIITRASASVLEVEEESEEEQEVLDVSEKVTSKVQEITPEESKERTELEALKSLIDKIKSDALEKHQKGLYDDAIFIYQKGLKEIQSKPLKSKTPDLLLLQTSLWNNIALCYKQLQNTDGELEFSSRVI